MSSWSCTASVQICQPVTGPGALRRGPFDRPGGVAVRHLPMASRGRSAVARRPRRSRRSLLRQRSIPRSSRRRAPEALACTRESTQRLGWKTLLSPGNPRRLPPGRRYQDRPVTPEVAGSSPVAAVSRSACKKALCVAGSDAPFHLVAQTSGAMRVLPSREKACKYHRSPPEPVICLGPRTRPGDNRRQACDTTPRASAAVRGPFKSYRRRQALWSTPIREGRLTPPAATQRVRPR